MLTLMSAFETRTAPPERPPWARSRRLRRRSPGLTPQPKGGGKGAQLRPSPPEWRRSHDPYFQRPRPLDQRTRRVSASLAHLRRPIRGGAKSIHPSRAMSWHCRINARKIRASSRTRRLRMPCFRAFIALVALPCSVFGPLDRVHGFQLRMSAACRSRRSGVQPLLMVQPQKFV